MAEDKNTNLILLINHWIVPYALQSNIRENLRELPYSITTIQHSTNPSSEWKMALCMFRLAKNAGFRTACFGVIDDDPHPTTNRIFEGHLPDPKSRFSHIFIDTCSSFSVVNSVGYRSKTHDLQALSEAYRFIDEYTDSFPLFVCVNLLSCRDTECISFFTTTCTQKFAPFTPGGATTLESAIPLSVQKPREYGIALDYSSGTLCDIILPLTQLMDLALSMDARIAVSTITSLAIGEHGYFGTSPMTEGTMGFLSSNLRCECECIMHSDVARVRFVEACISGSPFIDNSFPQEFFRSVVSNDTVRFMICVHERWYSVIGLRVFDVQEDKHELNDIKASLCMQIQHKLANQTAKAKPNQTENQTENQTAKIQTSTNQIEIQTSNQIEIQTSKEKPNQTSKAKPNQIAKNQTSTNQIANQTSKAKPNQIAKNQTSTNQIANQTSKEKPNQTSKIQTSKEKPNQTSKIQTSKIQTSKIQTSKIQTSTIQEEEWEGRRTSISKLPSKKGIKYTETQLFRLHR